ncbi:MAG TPA: hypothetical protein VGC35_10455 [Allosphingosinicella sp.]|jgi:hypothetical protein
MSLKTPAFAIAAAALLLAGCQAKVSHPTKTLAEQQVDIEGCSSAANDKYWMDPIAALLHAYDCLEAKGYRRGDAAVASKVERAVNNRPGTEPAKPGEPVKPCRIPCTPRR